METLSFRMRCIFIVLVCGVRVASVPNEWSAGKLYNSSVACARGSQQTYHDLDCRNAQPVGLVGRMHINRVFYGTPPLSKGCNRTAPFSSCCLTDPEIDCTFASDQDMEDLVRRFSGYSRATFSATRRSSSLGNCDPNVYPSLTSFSFVEFGCASVSVLNDMTASLTSHYREVLYLDSNGYFNNSDVKDSEFHCVAQTECNSSVSFVVLLLLRAVTNYSQCAEEFFFGDGKHPEVTSNLTCAAGDLVFNQVVFTSVSNVATITMLVRGLHTGKVFIQAKTSQKTSDISLTCGAESHRILDNLEPCPDDAYSVHSTTVTPTTLTPMSSSTTVTPTTLAPMSSSATGEDINVGLIIGLILAVLVVLLLLIVLFCFIRRRRQGQALDTDSGVSAVNWSQSSLKAPGSDNPVENTYNLPNTGSDYYSAPPSYTEISGDYIIAKNHMEEDQRNYYLQLEREKEMI